ncbi:MAG: hypothetical protein WCS42_16010 [Verrucomicrobiota bacterium]
MNTQDLMFFEAEAVAIESAKCEAQRAAEQHEREAKAAAKVLLKVQRDQRKAEEETAKSYRRFQRDTARKFKTPNEHAQCGIRWYCRSPKDIATGSYWHNCHACGQPLIYTSDPNATPQVCRAATA